MSQTATQIATMNLRSERPTILRAQGVKKSFETGRDILTILKNVDLTVKEGEFVAIEGKSGSGKSTLLHIMGGLDVADSGTLEFDGRRYAANPKGWLYPTPFRRLLNVSPKVRMFVEIGITILFMIALWVMIALSGLNVSPNVQRILAGVTAVIVLVALFRKIEIAIVVVAYLWFSVAGACLAYAQTRLWWLGPATALALLVLCGGYLALCGYLAERPVCRLRTKSFGFVFQFYHLLPELNVLENALMPAMVERTWLRYTIEKAKLKAQATQILKELGLGDRLQHRPNQLSGGERQRVAIARALMNQPRLLFADEPTGNLDVETGLQIMGVLEKLHRDHKQTIIMVTHDRSVANMADRVMVLKNGRLESANG